MVDIVPRPLPGLRSYHVVTARLGAEEADLAATALQVGEALAQRHYGEGGGFVVLFSSGAGRRRPWPHAHVVAVRSVAHKRVVLGLLLVKGWLARLVALQKRRMKRAEVGPSSAETLG